jgi:hypothetical protein
MAGEKEYKREKHINKTVNTSKHVQEMMAFIKNRSELSTLKR